MGKLVSTLFVTCWPKVTGPADPVASELTPFRRTCLPRP
ncbi:hypothetical protein QFZ55_006734 [Streptomyces luteogriseus]|nr:hypothetical protein [Streptomyces luteogriseus]